MVNEEQPTSKMQELWNRRFFQYVGTYLGLSFGLLQFMDFLVNRYQLNPSLVDKLFIFLIAMLPAVAVFIYNHGRRGHDSWRPFEKVFIPLSLILGIGLATVLFNGSSAQAATEKISIANLNGVQETRVVPKVEFTKRFAIFPFENESGDESDDWVNVGLAYLLDKDMEQFMMNYAIHPLSMKDEYAANNIEFLADIPFASQLKIAQEYYSDYFIAGTYKMEGEKIQLSGKVYDSQKGQLFFEQEVTGVDIYDVVDQFSTALDEHLYLKDNLQSLDVVDLPASNLITPDLKAFQSLMEGMILGTKSINNVKEAITKIEKSVEIDPNCASCYAFLSQMYFGVSDELKMEEASEKAVTLSSALPERQRLMINYYNYGIVNELDKMEKLLKNWCQLYPHDYTPFSLLMSHFLRRQHWGKAEEVGLDAFEKGHKGSLLYSLATIYISKGEFEKAEEQIDKYYSLYPHKSKDKSLLEKIYSGRGQLKKAKDLYENELVMDPGNIDMLIKLGTLEDQLGNYDAGLDYYEEALQKSRTVQDSVKAYSGMEAHYERFGQYEKSFGIMEQRKALMTTYMPPAQFKQMLFFGQAIKRVQMQRGEEYFAALEDLKKELPQNAELLACVANYLYYLWAEDLEQFEKYSDQCLESTMLLSSGKDFIHIDKGAKAEMKGDFAAAIKHYQTYVDSTGTGDLRMASGLASVYRQNGDLDKALEAIETALNLDPTQASMLLEKSRILKDQGKSGKAEKLYKQVMEIWKDADADYKPYQEALEYGKELEVSS